MRTKQMEENLEDCAVEDSFAIKIDFWKLLEKCWCVFWERGKKLIYNLIFLEPIHQPGCPVAV